MWSEVAFAIFHQLTDTTVPATAGMLFVQKPDPYDGTKEVVRVVRDDGKRLPAENVWFSKSGFGTETEYFLNLYDTASIHDTHSAGNS